MFEYWFTGFLIGVALTIILNLVKGRKSPQKAPLIGVIEVCYDDPEKDLYSFVINDLDDLDKNNYITLEVRKK